MLISSPTRPGICGFVHSLTYVALNTVISVSVALPAAYAFSRYRFIGDKHLFFWLLSNLMAPPAVYAMPFFNLYYCDRPVRHGLGGGAGALPVQRAAGGVDPGGLHVAACRARSTRRRRIDGYSFPRFFIRIFLPLIANGIGVDGILLLHVLLGRAVARHDADDGQRQADRRGNDARVFGRRHGLGRCWPPPAC